MIRVLACEKSSSRACKSEGTGGGSHVWDKIWKLEIPRHVKDFLCRGCQDVAAHKINLCSKRVYEETACDFCGRDLSQRTDL